MGKWRKSEEGRRWQANRRAIYKKHLLAYKNATGRCELCGWNEHPEILQFDHVNKEDKKFNFSAGCLGNYNWQVVLNELKKCRVICPNCHSWRHYNEKEWFLEKSRKGGLTTASKKK